ncbi:uncharacterized protein G2W53_021968 [Senna tora]|uniref:Uncharacterized protein n=1 Tax=Senna tora TaxID=362788 RepID=A0A834TM71_9FABA|nr:uncharacterized protein G2W53_021968 [Senna tora]
MPFKEQNFFKNTKCNNKLDVQGCLCNQSHSSRWIAFKEVLSAFNPNIWWLRKVFDGGRRTVVNGRTPRFSASSMDGFDYARWSQLRRCNDSMALSLLC